MPCYCLAWHGQRTCGFMSPLAEKHWPQTLGIPMDLHACLKQSSSTSHPAGHLVLDKCFRQADPRIYLNFAANASELLQHARYVVLKLTCRMLFCSMSQVWKHYVFKRPARSAMLQGNNAYQWCFAHWVKGCEQHYWVCPTVLSVG